MTGLSIGTVAKKSGLAASAIRYYESMGLISRPARRGGKRRYGMDIFDELGLVRLGRCAGFTVVGIKNLRAGIHGQKPVAWATLIQRKQAEVEQLIERAVRMKRLLDAVSSCACDDLRTCTLPQR